MILITNIEYKNIPFKTLVELESYAMDNVRYDTERGPAVGDRETLRKELIQGMRYRLPLSQEDIYIGIDARNSELLGLQYDAWADMHERLDSRYNYISTLQRASFWARLKWVFTGAPRHTE